MSLGCCITTAFLVFKTTKFQNSLFVKSPSSAEGDVGCADLVVCCDEVLEQGWFKQLMVVVLTCRMSAPGDLEESSGAEDYVGSGDYSDSGDEVRLGQFDDPSQDTSSSSSDVGEAGTSEGSPDLDSSVASSWSFIPPRWDPGQNFGLDDGTIVSTRDIMWQDPEDRVKLQPWQQAVYDGFVSTRADLTCYSECLTYFLINF